MVEEQREAANEKCDRLFTYGTLKSGYSRNYLLSGLEYEKAILLGYRMLTPPNLGFPFIIQDKESNVTGEIYYQLTQSHWKQIDLVEGEGSLYHRVLVEVKTISKRRNLSAFTYYPSKRLIKQYSEK
ncbi:MAG: gamma-glutamylcyclotransferase [Candidatus Hodarchaeota archaeon]